jgi:hypothetical protein
MAKLLPYIPTVSFVSSDTKNLWMVNKDYINMKWAQPNQGKWRFIFTFLATGAMNNVSIASEKWLWGHSPGNESTNTEHVTRPPSQAKRLLIVVWLGLVVDYCRESAEEEAIFFSLNFFPGNKTPSIYPGNESAKAEHVTLPPNQVWWLSGWVTANLTTVS